MLLFDLKGKKGKRKEQIKAWKEPLLMPGTQSIVGCLNVQLRKKRLGRKGKTQRCVVFIDL